MLSTFPAQYSSVYSGSVSGHESAPDIKPFLDQARPSGPSAYHSHHPGSQMYSSANPHDNMVYVLPSDSKGTRPLEQIPKSAGSRWRDEETMSLVEIWRDKICQTRWWKQNKCVRVNKEMWDEIAAMLMEKGIYRTASQCQIRMKNLLQYFRQMVDHRRNEKSREELPNYFEIVHEIMNGRNQEQVDGMPWRKRAYVDDDDEMGDDMMNGSPTSEKPDNDRSSLSSPPKTDPSGKPEASSTRSLGSPPPIRQPRRRPSSLSPRLIADSYPPRTCHDGDQPMPPSSTTMATAASHYAMAPPQYQFAPPDGYILRAQSAQRFPLPSRMCLPLTNHHGIPIPLAAADAAAAMSQRCTGTHALCCAEPPLKRHCNDSNCNMTVPSAKTPQYIGSTDYPPPPPPPKIPTNCRVSMTPAPLAVNCPQPQSMPQNHATPYTPYATTNGDTDAKREPDGECSGGGGGERKDCSRMITSLTETMTQHMTSLLELERERVAVEKRRLAVEERRLAQQDEADARNGAFLMEAVRMLASACQAGQGRNGQRNGVAVGGKIAAATTTAAAVTASGQDEPEPEIE